MADNFQVPVPAAWSFPEGSTAELARRLARAGAGATLVAIPYRQGELMFLHLRVMPHEVSLSDLPPGGYEALPIPEDEPDINDSKPCPPFTGCGGGG